MNLINMNCSRAQGDDLSANGTSTIVAVATTSTPTLSSSLNTIATNSSASICLPPPSDIGKDVEQIHRFELEI